MTTYTSNFYPYRDVLYFIFTKNATVNGYINEVIFQHNIVVGVDIMFKIDKEFKSANISRTIRFTESLFEQLNKTAAENDISFNLLVLQCCKYALENQEQKEEK